MIVFKQSGSFNRTNNFLDKASNTKRLQLLHKYGKRGVVALSSATPVSSGLTAKSWSYEIRSFKNSYTLTWVNSNVNNGIQIAILIQYGHGTRNGGYVHGRDYVNPAIRPIFDKLSVDLWKEVTSI